MSFVFKLYQFNTYNSRNFDQNSLIKIIEKIFQKINLSVFLFSKKLQICMNEVHIF